MDFSSSSFCNGSVVSLRHTGYEWSVLLEWEWLPMVDGGGCGCVTFSGGSCLATPWIAICPSPFGSSCWLFLSHRPWGSMDYNTWLLKDALLALLTNVGSLSGCCPVIDEYGWHSHGCSQTYWKMAAHLWSYLRLSPLPFVLHGLRMCQTWLKHSTNVERTFVPLRQKMASSVIH